MDATTHQSVNKFSGINNVDLATRLYPVPINHEYVYPLQQALNVEIDNTFGVSSRVGFTSARAGADIHSLWSDGVTCLYVDGAILYQMDSIYGRVEIRSGLTLSARMSYVNFNDRIYYSNGSQIGYLDGTDNALMLPEREFKESLPAGQFIDVFKGCLYAAKDDTLYISDPLCDYYDIRSGYRRFKEKITMLRAVDEGIYISDDRIWFIKGKGNDEFERDEVYPSRAISYTDVRVSGKYIDDGVEGDVALWTGENGICLGDNGGKVVNLTDARYTFTSTGQGAGFIREKSSVRHYINTLY
jgi:hypothetical protein